MRLVLEPTAPLLRTESIGGDDGRKGIQPFQTAGEFKVEAVGEPDREVNYGYVLLGLRK